MKKSILIVILSIVMMFTSCSGTENTEPNNTTTQSGGASVILSVPEHPKNQIFCYIVEEESRRVWLGMEEDDFVVIPSPVEEYERADAPQTIEYKFNGVEHTLKYYGTKKTSCYGDEFDCYEKTLGSDFSASVFINVNTGKICASFVTEKNYNTDKEKQNAKKLDEDERIAVAMDFLNQNVDDFSKYTLIKKEISSVSNKCSLTFSYFINGFQTSDKLSITVTPYGDIDYFSSTNPGHMKNAEIPEEYNLAYLENKMDAFLHSIYDGYVYDFDYIIKNIQFVRLYNGEYAFIYSVSSAASFSASDVPVEDKIKSLYLFIMFI